MHWFLTYRRWLDDSLETLQMLEAEVVVEDLMLPGKRQPKFV